MDQVETEAIQLVVQSLLVEVVQLMPGRLLAAQLEAEHAPAVSLSTTLA
ncbi:hypothetical protein [Synechococcus sp. RS9916]|nr:hypothetical protein [Synechococcus sp. RS9916]EAU73488.1 hypothetical protein RS9916_28304 [Synechococcus sp. RS9916]